MEIEDPTETINPIALTDCLRINLEDYGSSAVSRPSLPGCGSRSNSGHDVNYQSCKRWSIVVNSGFNDILTCWPHAVTVESESRLSLSQEEDDGDATGDVVIEEAFDEIGDSIVEDAVDGV